MPGPSVTVVDSGGLAVTAVESGAPEFEAVESGGVAITLVESGGLPMIVSGGTPTPPFAFPEGEMLLGMGLAKITSYAGYYPFANILWNANAWEKASGSAEWGQEWGVITHPNADGATDRYRAVICDAVYDSLPAGVYTVNNPDGCKIGIGAYSSQNLAAFTTETSFTFTYAQDQLLAIHAEGPVTNNNGPIEIIMPGRAAAFASGDYWNPEFIAFEEALNPRVLRSMDWCLAYTDISEEWSDVPVGLPITLVAPQTQLQQKVPYQLFFDLCNRLNADAYIHGPIRASEDYMANLAQLAKDSLNPVRYVWIEKANEVWNISSPYLDTNKWCIYETFTKRIADANLGIQGWTLPAHGMADGDQVSAFFTKENFTKSGSTMAWPLGWGNGLYVDVIDADNFVLYSDVARTVLVPSTANTPKLLHKWRGEAGKVADENGNYGRLSLRDWQACDAVLGRGRCVHVLATQLVDTAKTTARLAPTGVSAATDVVATANYYQGEWWLGALDIASGQVTPKLWALTAASKVRIAVYANGSTPTSVDVKAGAGTGYVGHRDITIPTSLLTGFTSASAITGLTNGTVYEYRAIFTDPEGFEWGASGQFTASASASTITFNDSDANMAARARHNTKFWMFYANAQRAAAGSIPIINYESGSDYFGPGGGLSQLVRDWRSAYTQTEIAGDAFEMFYRTLAANDYKASLQFVDIAGSSGIFNLAESLSDTSDYRYVAFAGFNGAIARNNPVSVGDILADDVATEPSYPAAVHIFADPALTYSIYHGDLDGNFTVSGHTLQMVGDAGINWSVPTSHTLTIEASDGVTTDYFDVSFATGFSWYAADAQFVWDSMADTDPAAINPIIGGTLALTGTAATVSGDLWDLEAAGRYSSSTALTATLSGDNPFLFATVLDKDNHTSFGPVMRLGGTTFVDVFVQSSIPRIRVYNNLTTTEVIVPFVSPAVTGKHVYWLYYDADPTTPKIHVGVDQVENGSGTAFTFAGRTISRNIVVGSEGGSNFSRMKHGTIEVLGRAGLTLSEALEYVDGLQTHHGIA